LVSSSGIGCFIRTQCVNILAYADDLVLLASSWHALQSMLNILHIQSFVIDLTCNVTKTVCMICMPKSRHRIFSTVFPSFTIDSSELRFVSYFKCLGHIVTNNLSDDDDIQREMRLMFVRCKLLQGS